MSNWENLCEYAFLGHMFVYFCALLNAACVNFLVFLRISLLSVDKEDEEDEFSPKQKSHCCFSASLNDLDSLKFTMLP